MRPKWYKPVMAAAAAVVLICGIAGSMTLMKKMKKTSPDPKANGSVIRSDNSDDIYVNAINNYYPDGIINFYDLRYRAYDKGCTYQAGDKLYYLDFETMEKTPFCAKPNCTHNSGECLARQAKNGVVHGDHVYFFTTDYGMKETKDGKPVFEMASKLMRSSLESSETETVCSFDDAIPRYEDALVIDGDTLYFNAYDPSPEIDDAVGVSYANGQGYAYLCSVDLDTGKYTNYGVICCEEDYGGRKSSRVYMTGADNGRIYMDYQFVKDKDGGFAHYNYEFDLETKEYSRSELPAGVCAAKGVYVWLDDEGDKLHVIKDGKDNTFDYTNYSNAGYVFGSKVFVSGNWIDLTDMTIHSFEPNISPVAYYNGCYIFAENNQFKKLTEEELLAQDKSSGSNSRKDTGTGKVHYICRSNDIYENGLIYGVPYDSRDKAYYLDFSTMEKTALCAKPNCDHTTGSCLSLELTATPVGYNGYMYFFKSNEHVEELKDGKRELRLNSKLKRASLDNSSTEVVCEFKDCSPRIDGGYILDGSKLYFIGYAPDSKNDEYGQIGWGSAGGEDYLCCIDLDTFEYKNLGIIREKPEQGIASGSAHLAGCYKGNFYIGYSYIAPDGVQPRNENKWTYECYEFSPDTGAIEKSRLPYPCYCDEDTYVSFDEDSDTGLLLWKGKEYSIPEGNCTSASVTDDGKLFIPSGYYDIETMTKHSYKGDNDRLENYHAFVAEFYSSYILMNIDGSFIKVTEKELSEL